MSLFKKLFGKKETKEHPIVALTKEFEALGKKDNKTTNKTEYSNFQELLEQNAGLSFEKQQIFNDLTGALAWNINLNTGTLSFGNLEFPIQVIGSLSFNDYSWMWGWANSKSGIPENLLGNALELKRIGENKQIRELTEGHFASEEGFEHKMGLIATGIFKTNAYFCANYGQGTMVLTIKSDKISKIDNNQLEKVLTTFPQVISAIDLNHKNTFKNYLIDRNLEINITENKIEGIKGGKRLTAEFDDLNRLKSLNGEI